MLTYDASHFSALVAMETTKNTKKDDFSALPGWIMHSLNHYLNSYLLIYFFGYKLIKMVSCLGAVPLVDPELRILPIHYIIDPGPNTIWGKHDNDSGYIHSLQLSIDQQLKLVSIPDRHDNFTSLRT